MLWLAGCAAPPFAAYRRLAFDTEVGAGLVMCDASGTLLLRRAVAGFSLPRFGAACPLWPLFTALARPMQPIEALVEWGASSPTAPRYVLRAYGEASHPQGFAGPQLRRAMMLILPAPETVPQAPALGVGATCRICPREGCAARREPSIMASAPTLPRPTLHPLPAAGRATGL